MICVMIFFLKRFTALLCIVHNVCYAAVQYHSYLAFKPKCYDLAVFQENAFDKTAFCKSSGNVIRLTLQSDQCQTVFEQISEC